MYEDFAIARITGTIPAAAKDVTFDSPGAESASYHPALPVHVVKKGFNGAADKLWEYSLDCLAPAIAETARDLAPGVRVTAFCSAVGIERMPKKGGDPRPFLYLFPYALQPASADSPDGAELTLCGTITGKDIVSYGAPPHNAQHPRITLTIDRGNGKNSVFPLICFNAVAEATADGLAIGDRLVATVRPIVSTVKRNAGKFTNTTYSVETIFPHAEYMPAHPF